ncbi:uncharacterized protein SETTUDRAFT_164801 [Exserohilum turcica Et28A]|uniref:Uncharacterized protein n=1 Tax=Exserohilum turcicum (strain 28A) TaxID=671987 RepID=R0JQG2_EXST2|nr:uncharacterized protein SETTUDRAFT_164801 [Exserohilum turcica Et28A]EOA83413.1 hypothetical protein SETTUDRAFT_164801 [Exserohilum turcica Et28A]
MSSWNAEVVIALVALLVTCIPIIFAVHRKLRGQRIRGGYETDLERRNEIALERRNTL